MSEESSQLNIFVLNLNHLEDTDEADRPRHRQSVLESVSTEPSGDVFILLQGALSLEEHHMLIKRLGGCCKNGEEATIYYRVSNSVVSEIDHHVLQSIQYSIRRPHNHHFTSTRLSACVVTSLKGEKILLVSWLGPDNNLKDIEKTLCFYKLVHFSSRLRFHENCTSVVIGGGFNLKSKVPARFMRTWNGGDVLCRCGGSNGEVERSACAGDYLVYWPKENVQILHMHEVPLEQGQPKKNGFKSSADFHSALLYRVQVTSAAESSENPQKE